MNWLTIAKYGIPLVALVLAVLAIDDNGYARGRDAANAVCIETVKAAKKEVQDQCDATLNHSKDLSHDLQASLDTTRTRYYELLKARCGKPLSSATGSASGGNDGPPDASQSAWLLTLDQRYLNDKQAAQLVSCQDTVATVYIANGREDLLPKEYQTKK